MKKILFIVVAILSVFSIIACKETTTLSETSTTTTASTDSSTTTTEYVVLQGILDRDVNQGEMVDLLEGITAISNLNNDYTDDIIVSSDDCIITDNRYLDTSTANECSVVYTISVGGYTNQIAATYVVIEQYINPNAITVYFQKPVDWEDVQVYYFDANISYGTTWENAPEMNVLAGHEGWYYFTFHELISSIKVIFKNSTDNQVPANESECPLIETSTWFLDEYYAYQINDPFAETEENLAEISVSSNTPIFANNLEFTISIESSTPITEMYFELNGTTTTLTETLTNVNLGSEFYIGERLNLVIYATNAAGQKTSFIYLFIKSRPTYFEPLTVNDEFNKLSIYEIYVDAYQDGDTVGYAIGYGPSAHHGDLQGIINALDYIASLNVNAIWLTPIFTSKASSSYSEWETRGRSTGYYADDYFHVDPNFGTDAQFRELVDKAHDLGLYVFLDGVFGHHGSYPIEGVQDGDAQWYGYLTEFPESLDYFIAVAQYWIIEYGIDGWRLDQSYQLYQDYYNYWRDIRIAVDRATAIRRANGETWGTLGYLVAEDWESVSMMNLHAYGGSGLNSAFNFPVRYAIVASLGMDESSWHASFYDINNAMNSPYLSYAQPNLFLTNHDVVRFGDLLQLSGNDGDEYYIRHKMALSFLAQYTGPITIYYGDEYGDEFTGLNTSFTDLNVYSDVAIDNVARTTGKISDFDNLQLDLIAYTSRILELRNMYSAMSIGERENLYVDSNLYIDLKTASDSIVLYGLNRLSTTQTKSFSETELGGTRVINLLTNEVIYPVNHVFTIPFDGLSGMFYLVTD